jgi:hypothetical protein
MSPPRTFYEDRATYVRFQLLEDTDGTEAAKDIASGFAAYLRGYQVPGTLVIDETMTIIAITGGDYIDAGAEKSGVEAYVKPTASADRIVCRVVLAETGVTDALTPSGKREYCWLEWEARVEASPQP